MASNIETDATPIPSTGKPEAAEEKVPTSGFSFKMASNIESDATPIPPTRQPEAAEEKVPTSDKKKKPNKKPSKKSESSSDSDLDIGESQRSAPKFGASVPNVVNINQASNVHIGNSYKYSNILQYSKRNVYSANGDGDIPASCKDWKVPKVSEEILSSEREVVIDDMYIIAEHISVWWKKLARFLPPRNVFSDGQLQTFQDNNPHNLEEAIIEMLKTWKQRRPEEAIVGNLASTLMLIGKGDIAQKLKS